MDIKSITPNVFQFDIDLYQWFLLVCTSFIFVGALNRLYWIPQSKFPGPRLAALSYWYEFYYDCWLDGQYTWKIRDLHRQYGMYNNGSKSRLLD